MLYEERNINRIFLNTILVFSGCLFLIRLDYRHLWGAEELRTAGIASEMARTGDMVVPHLAGEPFLEEPPLHFWISSLIFRCFGESTYTAKLPAALAAILGTALVYILARNQKYTHLQALAVGLVLATSFEYFSLGRRCLIDTTLCLFTLGAMLSFYSYCCSNSHKYLWSVGFATSLSCTVLTSGLTGLIIIISPLLLWLFSTKSIRRKGCPLLLAGFILSLIPTGIWALCLHNRFGREAVIEVLRTSDFVRFTGRHPRYIEPFHYYLILFPGQFLPWSLLLPYAVMHQVRNIRDPVGRNPALFNLIWLGMTFLLLSISAGKGGAYLLPLYPAAALLVGTSICETFEKDLETDFYFELPSKVLAWAVVLVPLAFGLVYACLRKSPIGVIMSVPGFFLGLWAHQKARIKQWMAFYGIMVCSLFWLLLAYDAVVSPLCNTFNSFEYLFHDCRKLESEGAEIVLYKPSEQIKGASAFYLKQNLPLVYQEETLKESLLSRSNVVVLTCDKDTEIPEGTIVRKSFTIGKEMYVLFERRVPRKTYSTL